MGANRVMAGVTDVLADLDIAPVQGIKALVDGREIRVPKNEKFRPDRDRVLGSSPSGWQRWPCQKNPWTWMTRRRAVKTMSERPGSSLAGDAEAIAHAVNHPADREFGLGILAPVRPHIAAPTLRHAIELQPGSLAWCPELHLRRRCSHRTLARPYWGHLVHLRSAT